MPLFAQQPNADVSIWIMAIVTLVLLGFLNVWFFLCYRLWDGKPILPAYQPRRSVPWTGWDLLLILFFYLLVVLVIQLGVYFVEQATGRQIVQRRNHRALAAQKDKKKIDEKETTVHPLAQLLKEKDLLTLALAFSVGVVIAPICEEILFRLLLQGWLESSQRRWRRKFRKILHAVPRGILPIALSSLVFASLHFRKASPEVEEGNLIFSMLMTGVVYLLTVGFALGLVHWRAGATAIDLGWNREKFSSDVLLGVVAFLAIIVPLLVLQFALAYFVLPKQYAPDPIAIFFLAIVLGLLYYRTHRIVPSIVVHMLLNGTSLAMAWALL